MGIERLANIEITDEDILWIEAMIGGSIHFDSARVEAIKNMNSVGAVFEYMFRSYKDRHVKNGIATHDGCAVAYMIDPKIFEIKKMYAEVKYFKSIDSGVLLFENTDDEKSKKKPNVTVCTKVNIKRFRRLYYKLLKKCK